MRIGKVVTHNWMNYKGTHTHDFSDKDVIAIIAEFVKDKDASNQAGKSTIVEACLYALTGQSRAKKEPELIHYGQEVMWVDVELIEDDASYHVKRGRDHKNNGSLTLDWIEKTTEAQKEINNLIGYDNKEFKMISYVEQGEIAEFMKLDNAKKKAYIIKWFKSEHWKELEAEAKSKLGDKQKELDKLKAKIEAIEETFNNDVDLDTELEVLADELKDNEKKYKQWKAKVSKLRESATVSASDFSKAKKNLTKYKQKIKDINASIELNKKVELTISNTKKSIKALNKDITHTIAQAHKEVARCVQTTETLNDKINLAKEHKSGLCPVLSEPCDRIKFDPETIKHWETEVRVLKKEETSYREQIEKHMEVGELESKIQRLEKRIVKGEFHGEIADAEDIIKESGKTIKAYDSELPEKIANAEDNLERLEMEISDLKSSKGIIEEKIRAKKENEAKVLEYKKKVKVIALDIDDLQYLVAMFGKNGIPSLEIENGFADVEDEANYILQEMHPNMEMVMKPTTPTNTKEPTCLDCGWLFPKGHRGNCGNCGAERKMKQKDEMVFKISKDSKEYNYYMDSGGGITLIALAMRMALFQLKRRMDNSKLNVVFLDEPDSALDKRFLRMMIKLVATTFTKKLGIEQVFWISHNKDIQRSITHTYKVISNGKQAKAEWV